MRLYGALLQGSVIGFAHQREADVCCRVFMCTVNRCAGGQVAQALQRVMQLRQRAFLVAAAACAEQDVAAEQHVGMVKADVVVEMAGQFHYVEVKSELGQRATFAFAQIICDVRIVGMPASIHRHVVYFAQSGDAADMVVVSMGAEYGAQTQSVLLKEG